MSLSSFHWASCHSHLTPPPSPLPSSTLSISPPLSPPIHHLLYLPPLPYPLPPPLSCHCQSTPLCHILLSMLSWSLPRTPLPLHPQRKKKPHQIFRRAPT